MSLVHEADDCGFLRRLWRIYREKRKGLPGGVVARAPGFARVRLPTKPEPRRRALRVAWDQARNARLK